MLAKQIPLLAILIPMLTFIIFIEVREKHSSRFRRRCFLTRHLPRSPGESLRIELEQLNRNIAPYAAAAFTFPLLVWSACQSLGDERTWWSMMWLIVDTIAVTACIVYISERLVSLVRRKRELIVELETKMAVAQELNALIHKGYRVFHDVPAIGFNIAHVVVGKTGVFAIETRGVAGTNGRDDEPTWDVVYSGGSLKFPGWQETSAVHHAISHAAWLQDWLAAAGHIVAVSPVLVLPGWYIDQHDDAPVMVSNGKNLQALLGGATFQRPQLGGKTVRQIADRIGRRCSLDSTRSAQCLSVLEQELIAEPV